MAIQVENPAQLSEVTSVFKRRRWWFFVPVLLATGIGSLFAVLLPKKYEVDTQIKLIEVQYDSAEHFRTGGEQGALRRDLENAETEIEEPSRIHRIINELGWVDFSKLDALDREEFVEKVQDNLTVEVVPKAKDIGSSFVDLTYLDIDPDRAELFLERLTRAWVEELFLRDQRQISDKKEAELNRSREIRSRLASDRDAMYVLIQRYELPYDTGARRIELSRGDPIYDRIQARKKERLDVELEIAELEAELEIIEEGQFGVDRFTLDRDVVEGATNDDGQLGEIQLAILDTQKKLENLTSQNPKFAAYRAELNELRRQADERSGVTEATEVVNRRMNPRWEELEEQRVKKERELAVLERKRQTLEQQLAADEGEWSLRIDIARQVGELEASIAQDEKLLSEVETAVANHDGSLKMLNKLGASYEITKEPLAPEDPSLPNVPLVIIGAMLFGAVLGAALLVAREYLVPGFRTPSDAAADITVPILGIVGPITTHRERVARGVLAGATGVGTVLFLGLVVWFLWAYQERPELLGSELVDRIEEIQYALR